MSKTGILFKAGYMVILILVEGIAVSQTQDQLFQKASQTLALGDTSAAIRQFKKAIRKDPERAEGFHQLARIYLARGGLQNRITAQHWLDKAIAAEPDNIAVLETQLDLFMTIRIYGDAVRVSQKILRSDPENVKAFFHMAQIHEEDWFHFQDMQFSTFTEPIHFDLESDGSEGSGGLPLNDALDLPSYMGTFKLYKDATGNLEKAMMLYKRIIEIDPEFSPAYYRIACLCYEAGLFETMNKFLIECTKYDPGNKDYLLFLGLAAHERGASDEALEYYDQAMALMDADEKRLFESVDLIVSGKERRSLKRDDDEDQNQFTAAYWNSHDPLYITEANERKLEHYGRIAYANMRFSRGRVGIPGWKTDMGRTIVRYGLPWNTVKTRPNVELRGMPTTTGNAGMKMGHWEHLDMQFSRSAWQYDGFSIEFIDRNWTDKFTHADRDGFNTLVNKVPETYDFHPEWDRFTVLCTHAQFQDEEGNRVVEVYHAIPRLVVENQRFISMKRGIFLFDDQWNKTQSEIEENPFIYHPGGADFLTGWKRLKAVPGKKNLVLEFYEESGQLGRLKQEMDIEPVVRDALAMSDIVLASQIADPVESGELRRGGKRIVPNPLRTYHVASLIPFYLEIYNLLFEPDGMTRYRINLTVESADQKGGITGFVNRIIRRDVSGKVETSYDYRGNKTTEYVVQAVELDDPQPIDYRLTVTLTDLVTGEVKKRTAEFGLRE